MNTKPYKPYGGRKNRLWLKVLLALILAAVAVFALLEVYIAAHSRSRVANDPPPAVMVVFGCQMRSDGPSVLLKDRLDAALAYLQDHPDMTVVVTGGKGDDEHLSEAQGMYDYLTAHGVDGGRILREDKSFNTWQNVNNTMALMEQNGLSPTGGVILVSSGFHLSRIQLLWARAGGDAKNVSTLAAPVSHAPSAVHMFFREPFALVKSFWLDR